MNCKDCTKFLSWVASGFPAEKESGMCMKAGKSLPQHWVDKKNTDGCDAFEPVKINTKGEQNEL